MREGCTCAGDVHVNPNYLHALRNTRCPSVATIKRKGILAICFCAGHIIYISGQHRQITSRCVCVTFVRALRTFPAIFHRSLLPLASSYAYY